MPYSVVDKGSKYFNTVLYTGTGATQSITGVGFQPDWVWIKNRSNALSHCITDAVRGTNLQLASNSTGADQSTTDGITSFNSNGFSLGAGTQQYSSNTNAQTYASWNWLGANTTVSNTSGSITSTVSANTTSGFSIVSYTGNGTAGATVGHGLGAVPKMMIHKDRTTGSYQWGIYTSALGATKNLNFTSSGENVATSYYNDTAPTSTVFSLGTNVGYNANTDSYIAYCFAEVKGFSKFGSYVGNANANGTFVYTGFTPAFVMIKSTASSYRWYMFDNKRDTFNAEYKYLVADASFAEDSSYSSGVMDFVSNGFKLRGSDPFWNNSGETFIYMCFASNPFVSSKAIPTTAR